MQQVAFPRQRVPHLHLPESVYFYNKDNLRTCIRKVSRCTVLLWNITAAYISVVPVHVSFLFIYFYFLSRKFTTKSLWDKTMNVP